jgi:hypothetical protein
MRLEAEKFWKSCPVSLLLHPENELLHPQINSGEFAAAVSTLKGSVVDVSIHSSAESVVRRSLCARHCSPEALFAHLEKLWSEVQLRASTIAQTEGSADGDGPQVALAGEHDCVRAQSLLSPVWSTIRECYRTHLALFEWVDGPLIEVKSQIPPCSSSILTVCHLL